MSQGGAACCGKKASGTQTPTHSQAKRINRHLRRCRSGGGKVHFHFLGMRCTACGKGM